MALLFDFGATWDYRQVPTSDDTDYSTATTGWASGQAPFGFGFAGVITGWDPDTRLWVQRELPPLTALTISLKIEDFASVYLNGALAGGTDPRGTGASQIDPPAVLDIPSDLLDSTAPNILAIKADDDPPITGDVTYLDVQGIGAFRHNAPAMRGRQRGDGRASSSAPRGRQISSRQASLRGRAFL